MVWRDEEEAVQIRLPESPLAWFNKDESNARCRGINVRPTMNGLSLYWDCTFDGRFNNTLFSGCQRTLDANSKFGDSRWILEFY
jgi:hypothetical protein